MGRAKSRGQPSLMESSLCCVLAAFQGVTVVVELRNESIVRGTLETADHLMNLQMSKVAFTPFERPKQHLDEIYIKGKNIRMVHLPHKMSASEQLKLARKRQLDARAEQLKPALGPVNLPKTHQGAAGPSGNEQGADA